MNNEVKHITTNMILQGHEILLLPEILISTFLDISVAVENKEEEKRLSSNLDGIEKTTM